MNQSLQAAYGGYAGTDVSVEQRNRVLRNTYWLLALSMVPTVLGAWIGVTTGIARAMSPGMARSCSWSARSASCSRSRRPRTRRPACRCCWRFTFFMGLMLSRLVGAVLGLTNGAEPDHDGLRRHRR